MARIWSISPSLLVTMITGIWDFCRRFLKISCPLVPGRRISSSTISGPALKISSSTLEKSSKQQVPYPFSSRRLFRAFLNTLSSSTTAIFFIPAHLCFCGFLRRCVLFFGFRRNSPPDLRRPQPDFPCFQTLLHIDDPLV